MVDVTFTDKRTNEEKFKDLRKDINEKFKETIEAIDFFENEYGLSRKDIIIMKQKESSIIFCKYCLCDITFGYDEKKISDHLINCKLKLMESNEKAYDLSKKSEKGNIMFEK